MTFLQDKSISYWTTLIGFIITIISTYVALDSHYAKAEAVKQLELRLDQKIVADRSDKLQERIWKLEDRYPVRTKAPSPVQQQWKEIEREIYINDIKLKKSLQEQK